MPQAIVKTVLPHPRPPLPFDGLRAGLLGEEEAFSCKRGEDAASFDRLWQASARGVDV
jgi:hypothetical protein